MSKAQFTEKEQQVWDSLQGTLGNGLTTWQQENIVRDLDVLFGLRPTYINLGGKLVGYDWDVYSRNVHIRDGFCTAYYHPRDCGVITGSSPDNWGQWARLLFGKKSHAHSPRLSLPQDLYQMLRDRGYAKVDGPRRPHRFLSVAMVSFYIAAQTDAWDTPQQIAMMSDMKKMLKLHRVQVIDLVVNDEGVQRVLSGPPKADILGASPAPIAPSGLIVVDLLADEIKLRRDREQAAHVALASFVDDVTGPVAAQAPESSLLDLLGSNEPLLLDERDDAVPVPNQDIQDLLGGSPAVEQDDIPSESLQMDLSQMNPQQLQEMVTAMEQELEKRKMADMESYCSKAMITEGAINPILRTYETLTVRYPDGTCQEYERVRENLLRDIG